MKHRIALCIAALALLGLSGCGGPDREALAIKTVHDYWYDIGHGKISNAYFLLSSGVRGTRPQDQYTQDMYSFLENMGGISAKTGKVAVNGDQASVPVTLSSPKTSQTVHAYQHLYWNNGHWWIIDQTGGLGPK